MDKIVLDFVREYPTLIHHFVWICVIAGCFIALSGCIRFGIAVWRRHKGVYPPATSQMEDHH
jgi:hypothetical protein